MNLKFNKYKILIMFLFLLTFLSFLMTPNTLSKYTETFNKTLTLNISSNMASYTINATPSDSDIYLSVNGGEKMKVSSGSKVYVNKGSTISYEISHYRYYMSTGSITVNSVTVENTALTPDPRRQLTVKPNKPNQATQCVKLLPAPEGTPASQIVSGGYIYGDSLFYTSKYDIDNNDYTATTATVLMGDKIICSVATNGQCYKENNDCQPEVDYKTSEYNDYVSEVFTIGDDYTLNVELTEKPWITGSYSNTQFNSATNATLVNYHPGYYFVEMWGGTGGSGQDAAGALGKKAEAPGGAAGHVYGIIKLDVDESLYYSLGGNGETKPNKSPFTSSSSGGANGGGISNAPGSSAGSGGGGGGYSSLHYSNASGTLYMLAAGGGGGSGRGGNLGAWVGYGGGAGGNIDSTTLGSSNAFGGTIYNGEDGKAYSTYHNYGTGGSTIAGFSPSSDFTAETTAGQFYGGASHLSGGGGGAGYYGGGGGAKDGTGSDSNRGVGGGGGGSSFIYTPSDGKVTIPTSSFASSYKGSNPSSTGGGMIIKYIGKSLS